MVQLLNEHGLQNAVPFLDAEGVWRLDELCTVKETDVDGMVQRHSIDVVTMKLLKSKIHDKVFFTALEQVKSSREKIRHVDYTHRHNNTRGTSHNVKHLYACM